LQRVIQVWDPYFLVSCRQQQNGSGLASRMGENDNPPGPRPSVPHANAQTSSAPSASRPPLPGVQQVSDISSNLASMSLPQLRALYSQLFRIVMEKEKELQTAGDFGESDIQRQLRAKIDNNKRLLPALQEVIDAKTRAR
jgi:hypothetical protein